jgi:hypothetical protein
LSLLPPLVLPLTAFSGPSVLAQTAEPVAGLFRARLVAAVADGGMTSRDVMSKPDERIALAAFS